VFESPRARCNLCSRRAGRPGSSFPQLGSHDADATSRTGSRNQVRRTMAAEDPGIVAIAGNGATSDHIAQPLRTVSCGQVQP